jgi:hypothetical protein
LVVFNQSKWLILAYAGHAPPRATPFGGTVPFLENFKYS